MNNIRFTRGAAACALFGLASLAVSGCGGGGATIGNGPGGITAGAGAGSGSGAAGGGGSGATPTATPAGGASTANPSAPTATPSGGGSSGAAPTATPTSAGQSTATPSSLDSLGVVPAVIDGNLGGVAQIGVLDPNYSGPYFVSVTGGGLLGSSLNTLGNVVNGTLAGSSSGETTLTLDLANALQLGLLGPSGNAVTICEQQNPATCKSVNITNNGVVPAVGSTLSSIVFGPGGVAALSLIAPALDLSMFKVVAAPKGITVTNLGNGSFVVDAAANVAVPLTGSITIADGNGHTITIPVAVP